MRLGRLSLSICFLTIFSIIAGSVGIAVSGSGSKVDYPEGYRQWNHVKSMVIQPGHPLENPFQGIHHVYANGKANRGLKSGQFEDGSVLVFDLLKYQKQGSALVESDRKLVGIMQKDSSRFRSTGGWGFEGFAGNSKSKRLTTDGGKSCFQCHTSQDKHDFVFTQPRK